MLPTVFPTPVIYRPDAGEPSLRWGIVGPGWIAGVFARTVAAHTRQQVVAVASRSRAHADAFANDQGLERVHDSPMVLFDDGDIDVVYIATPPNTHLELGLQAIRAGKHVLIEKPLAMSGDEGRQLQVAARHAGVFLMEAMWSRYLPQTSVIRTLVADGVLGEIASLQADHGQAIPLGSGHRLLDPSLGGGALFDLGVYPVQFATMLLGIPERVSAIGSTTRTGVDGHTTVVLEYSGGAQATIVTSLTSRTPAGANVSGDLARLQVIGSINGPARLVLADNSYFTPQLEWTDPTGLEDLDALAWQATALARFVGEGRTESPVHTLDETVAVLDILTAARNQVGLAT